MRFTVKQGKNYEMGNSISINILLVTLNTSKIWPKYMISEKKIEENCLLHGFSAQTPESLTSLLVNKNSLHTYNQQYLIVSPNIWHYQIRHIGPLKLYKLRKKCLEVKLQGKTMF